MPTVLRTWTFATDNEGLDDQSNSSVVTIAYEGVDDVLSFGVSGNAGTIAETEYANRVSTGQTWETWGVPAGATVTSVQITAWTKKQVANTALTAHEVRMRILDSAGLTVHSVGDLIDVALATALDGSYVAQAAGTSRAVDVANQPSTTDVRLQIEYYAEATFAASSDLRLDAIELTITYSTTSSINRTVTENLGVMGDPVLRRVLTLRDVSESMGFNTPDVTWSRNILRLVAEELRIRDGRLLDGSLQLRVNYFRIVAESLLLVDFDHPGGETLVRRVANANRVATTSLALQDAVERKANAGRVISESLGLSDAVLIQSMSLVKLIRVIELLGLTDTPIFEVVRLLCEELQTKQELECTRIDRPPECADER